MSEPLVTWFLGSDTDAPIAKKGIGLLDELEILWDLYVASAHRTPKRVEECMRSNGAATPSHSPPLLAPQASPAAGSTTSPTSGTPSSGSAATDQRPRRFHRCNERLRHRCGNASTTPGPTSPGSVPRTPSCETSSPGVPASSRCEGDRSVDDNFLNAQVLSKDLSSRRLKITAL